VEFVVARDYAALIDAQASARIEYAIYSATAYATALQRCGCVEPLVAPVDTDGAAGIRSVLLTRDGKLSGLAAMETHRIAMPSALRVVWMSSLLRYGPHAVRSDLDPEAKRRLTVFLTNLKSTTPDVYDLLESKHSGGFLTVAPKDYAPAQAIVRLLSADGGQR